MPQPVIIDAVRTPFGRKGGAVKLGPTICWLAASKGWSSAWASPR